METEVLACYDSDMLRLRYIAQGERFFRNDHTTCNSETWNQEVVEVFISPGTEDPTHYHEVVLLVSKEYVDILKV